VTVFSARYPPFNEIFTRNNANHKGILDPTSGSGLPIWNAIQDAQPIH